MEFDCLYRVYKGRQVLKALSWGSLQDDRCGLVIGYHPLLALRVRMPSPTDGPDCNIGWSVHENPTANVTYLEGGAKPYPQQALTGRNGASDDL